MQLTDRLAPAADVVARDVAGETVLLDLASGTYFGLNEVGSRIWQWLDADAQPTLAEIVQRLQQEYAVAGDIAERDVLALARDLAEHGLVDRPPS